MKKIFIHSVYVSLERLTRKENDVSFLGLHPRRKVTCCKGFGQVRIYKD